MRERRGRRRWRRRAPILVAVVLAVVAGAGASAWALVGSSGSGYDTATVGYASVAQTLDFTGTVQPVDEATLSFQVAGKVTSVAVTVGQSVSSGQTLATLDTSSLEAAVSEAQSNLSSAEAKLTSDEQAQSSSSSTATATATATGGSSTDTVPTSSSAGPSSGQIAAAQQQIVADQHDADTAGSQAGADLQSATTVCQSSSGSGGSSSSGGAGGSAGTSSTGGTGGVAGSGTQSSQCTAALSQVLSDQEQEAGDLASVSKDEAALAQLLSQEQAALQSSSQSSSTTRQSSASGNSSSGSSTVTAATLASDQASIDSEQASLDQAEKSLSEATLTSPIAGVVAAVNITSGQSVAAGSTSADIVVQGPQSFEVTGNVPVSDVADIKVGDTASVTPDGASDPIAGTVSAIGTMPSSSSSSSSSSSDYTITVALPASASGLYNGAGAEVAVVTGEASHVLTVPTSALHRRGTFYDVEVLKNGTVSTVSVGVGVVGPQLTQVTSGLSSGASVVLADLSTAIPTSTSATGRSIVSLVGGGFPGGGGGGGFVRPSGG